jgi:hypothetical protein
LRRYRSWSRTALPKTTTSSRSRPWVNDRGTAGPNRTGVAERRECSQSAIRKCSANSEKACTGKIYAGSSRLQQLYQRTRGAVATVRTPARTFNSPTPASAIRATSARGSLPRAS